MPPTVLLHRLLAAQAADSLFRSFAPLLSSPAALFDSAGRRFAGLWPPGETLVPPGALWENRPAGARTAWGDPIRAEESLLYPLWIDGEMAGFLAAGEAVESPAVSALRESLALLLLDGLEKRSLARDTLERYREVNLLYRISGSLGAHLEPDAIIHIGLEEARRVIQSACGVLIYWGRGGMLPGGNLPGGQARSGDAAGAEAALAILGDETRRELLRAGPVLLTGLQDRTQSIDALLSQPLLARGEPHGLIALARLAGQAEFTAGDQKLLLAIANQVGIAVDRVDLYRQELARQQIEQELAIGRRIQRSLLPRGMPQALGWELAASYQAANQVGGDFYDIYPQQGGLLGVVMADVTGKGIPAALMMGFSHAMLHAAALTHPDPGDALAYANQQILQNSSSGMMLTAFYAVLNPLTGGLCYANGGHEPPYWYQASTGQVVEVECGRSLLMGARLNQPYRSQEIALAPGDVLVLYTDGITEARNGQGEFYMEERLRHVIAEFGTCSSEVVLRAILDSVRGFTRDAPPSDDVTVFVIKRLP